MNRDTQKGLDPTPSASRDPLTDTPGSHSVGTGLGAAAGSAAASGAAGTPTAGSAGSVVGATIGAVAGGLAGTVGPVVGAAIGVVAGGLAGKAVADRRSHINSNKASIANPPVLLDFVNKLETFNIPDAQARALRSELALLTAVAEVALTQHPRVPVCVQYEELVETHRTEPLVHGVQPQAVPRLKDYASSEPDRAQQYARAEGSSRDEGIQPESIVGKWPPR